MLYSLSLYEKILDVYSLIEILDLNDITEAEALEFLCEEEFIELPEIKPLDLGE